MTWLTNIIPTKKHHRHLQKTARSRSRRARKPASARMIRYIYIYTRARVCVCVCFINLRLYMILLFVYRVSSESPTTLVTIRPRTMFKRCVSNGKSRMSISICMIACHSIHGRQKVGVFEKVPGQRNSSLLLWVLGLSCFWTLIVGFSDLHISQSPILMASCCNARPVAQFFIKAFLYRRKPMQN